MQPRRVSRRLACLLTLWMLGGCATGSNPQDPFEPFNRNVYRFNNEVDQAILRPAARAYRAALPEFIRSSIGNVFSNIGDIRTALNNALQGKFSDAYADFGRFAMNSTLGMLGLFDIASMAGVEKHREDFGQTLGRWGFGDGPFIMLPILGPSNGRDLAALPVDFATDPVTYINPTSVAVEVSATRIVDRRAELLDASKILHDAALDEYQFVRDGYLQRRRNLIYDGNPPRDEDSLDRH
jgi:phospholipid-binding lipoprotein MlaA